MEVLAQNNVIQNPQSSVEKALQEMEVQAINFGYRFIRDASVRAKYMANTKAMSFEVRATYEAGQLSAKKLAEAANQMRNEIMEFARVKSSDLGRAKAKILKTKGIDLDQLVGKYAKELFGKEFEKLSSGEVSKVYLEIVDSAGRSRHSVNIKVFRLAKAGKSLWVLSACIAIYNVSNAEDKLKQTGREVSNIGGGFAGGATGGAAAGIWFGPVGVAIGVLIGGALGAVLADQIYIEVVGVDGEFAKSFVSRFTSVTQTNESAMAKALVDECSFELNKVLQVFIQLDDKYTTDADDVALLYVESIRKNTGLPTYAALKNNVELQEYLIYLLDSGWTDQREYNAIGFLKSLRSF